MVEVSTDGPLREDYIRTLDGKQTAQRFSGFGIYHGGAVNLPGEDRFGAQNLAGGDAVTRQAQRGLAGSDGCTIRR